MAAVLISLRIESRRRTREARLNVLRTLAATKHLPGDPSYSTAINLVPIEFNDQPEVMNCYKDYIKRINHIPTEENRSHHNTEIGKQQTKLIFAIMNSVRLKSEESDIATDGYAAGGMMDRDRLYLQSLEAQVRMADRLDEIVTSSKSRVKKEEG